MSKKDPLTLVPASPKVRKFARELGVDINKVSGSERDGRVIENDIKLFSSINVLPKDIDVESADTANGGYHREQGGYIYYIHPAWESSWGGNLKFKDCDVDKVEPKPNRFVWVNPDVWHGIEVVDSSANTNRVTVVAWPTGTVTYPDATAIINTKI